MLRASFYNIYMRIEPERVVIPTEPKGARGGTNVLWYLRVGRSLQDWEMAEFQNLVGVLYSRLYLSQHMICGGGG